MDKPAQSVCYCIREHLRISFFLTIVWGCRPCSVSNKRIMTGSNIEECIVIEQSAFRVDGCFHKRRHCNILRAVYRLLGGTSVNTCLRFFELRSMIMSCVFIGETSQQCTSAYACALLIVFFRARSLSLLPPDVTRLTTSPFGRDSRHVGRYRRAKKM